MTRSSLPDYAVVTPVRDEVGNLPRTIAAMLAQSHRPVRWVIVDDGSRDGTREIAEACAAEHQWVRVIDSDQGEGRSRGGRIVRNFKAGLRSVDETPEFVVKMDADVFIPPHYFEWIATTFARVGRAGILGGLTYLFDGVRWALAPNSLHNTSGTVKSYRSTCLQEIGGLQESMGWDGIDEYAARARGWEVHVLTELPILHYEKAGSKQAWYRARWEEGRGAHYMGYLPAFFLARVVYRMVVDSPPLLSGLVMAAGYASARLTGARPVEDPSARAVLRAEQRARLRQVVRLRSGDDPQALLPGGGPAFWVADGYGDGAIADVVGDGRRRD